LKLVDLGIPTSLRVIILGAMQKEASKETDMAWMNCDTLVIHFAVITNIGAMSLLFSEI